MTTAPAQVSRDSAVGAPDVVPAQPGVGAAEHGLLGREDWQPPGRISRERSLIAAFVSVAHALGEDSDLVEMLGVLAGDCVRLLEVDAVGVVVLDSTGVLQVVVGSTEATRLLELHQFGGGQGPGLEAHRGAKAVAVPDLNRQKQRWPDFAEVAAQVGYASVHVLPMGPCGGTVGVLDLFRTRPGQLERRDLRLAQAPAQVAALTVATRATATDQAALNSALQEDLAGRVLIEQAKGLPAQLGELGMDASFAALRRYSHDHYLTLREIVRASVARELPGDHVLDHARTEDATAAGRDALQ